MRRLSLAQEDGLCPIARVGDALWLFSRFDGCLYALLPDGIRRTTPGSGALFVVPGDRSYFRLGTTRVDRLSVEEFELTGSGEVVGGGATEHVLPSDGSQRPSGIVASEGGSRMVLMSSEGSTITTGIDVRTGSARAIRHPAGMTVVRILDNGAPVLAGGDRYIVSFAGRELTGTGTIIATTGKRVLARDASHDRRVFRAIEDGRERRLQPPVGWSPIQATFGHDGGVLMTCVHPHEGYGFWRENGRQVRPLHGTIQSFALEGAAPALRTTGVTHGSMWVHGSTVWPGAAAPRSDISAEQIHIDGMPCIHYRSVNSRAVVVAYHGGPDSHEWDDLRYGGSYRVLVDRGIDVLVVNYPGSADLRTDLQVAAWQRWPQAATRSARALAEYCRVRGYGRLIALGVSFGAWFAALSADELGADGVVAMSPILAMRPHLDLHAKRDAGFARWAARRFGLDHRSAREGDDIVAHSRVPVVAIVPAGDEVVDAPNALPLWPRQVTVKSVPGHHYPRVLADMETRWQALVASVEQFAGTTM